MVSIDFFYFQSIEGFITPCKRAPGPELLSQWSSWTPQPPAESADVLHPRRGPPPRDAAPGPAPLPQRAAWTPYPPEASTGTDVLTWRRLECHAPSLDARRPVASSEEEVCVWIINNSCQKNLVHVDIFLFFTVCRVALGPACLDSAGIGSCRYYSPICDSPRDTPTNVERALQR